MSADFRDFDDPVEFHRLVKKAKHPNSENFVIDFSHDKARCAFDVDESQVNGLLRTERPEASTRWINLWAPNRQVKVVEHLARTYGFSPRLTGLMRSQPQRSKSSRIRMHHRLVDEDSSPGSSLPDHEAVELEDLEKAAAGKESQDRTEADLMRDLNHYDIVSTIYHYSSVDIGVKYLCLGCNWLHNVKPDREGESGDQDLPKGERLWSWLILCDDKTVISMFEDPYVSMDSYQRSVQDATKLRRNLLNVFVQLSKASSSSTRNPISLVPIRHVEVALTPENDDSEQNTLADAQIDGPGLLFYYLFDDWYASYALLAKEEHHYGRELNKLRDEMLESPKLVHINALQHIGRQLAVLKRLYESYELVINRVLEKQRSPMATTLPSNVPHPACTASHPSSTNQSPMDQTQSTHSMQTAQSVQGMQSIHTGSERSDSTPLARHDSGPIQQPTVTQPLSVALFSRPVCVRSSPLNWSAWPPHYHDVARSQFDASYDQFGVYLTSAARVRFERLRDRVRLYAISEISEGIDLVASLTTMNYNLIAFQETTSMERLTRVTTLLSKATILFLPVSFLSSYFAIDWTTEDKLYETRTAYWTAFAVIFLTTFFLLVVFGVMSRTLEGRVVYQPIWRVGVELFKGIRGAGRAVGDGVTGGSRRRIGGGNVRRTATSRTV